MVLTDWFMQRDVNEIDIQEYHSPDDLVLKPEKSHESNIQRDLWGIGMISYYIIYKKMPYSIEELRIFRE